RRPWLEGGGAFKDTASHLDVESDVLFTVEATLMMPPRLPGRYTAIVAEGDIQRNELVTKALSSDVNSTKSLAGESPTLRFWMDQVVLISTPGVGAAIKWCSFITGDAIRRAVRVGDVVVFERDVFAEVSVYLFRDNRLIVAIGAINGQQITTEFRAYL